MTSQGGRYERSDEQQNVIIAQLIKRVELLERERRSRFSFNPANISFTDVNGNILIADDTDVPYGLALPYIPWGIVQATDYTTPPEVVTSGTFVTAFYLNSYRIQPSISVLVRVNTAASTTAEVQLLDTAAATVSPLLSVAAGTTVNRLITMRTSGTHLAQIQYEVQARRVSGAGNVRIGVLGAFGTNFAPGVT